MEFAFLLYVSMVFDDTECSAMKTLFLKMWTQMQLMNSKCAKLCGLCI